MDLFDARRCALGEGPLWHPERQQLFWFDILGKRLLSRDHTGALEWQFDEYVSAAGWVDHDALLMASETGLYRFDINNGERSLIAALEADNPATRSNDGRVDPWGGFWIGTMGKQAEPGQGAIYRFYQGEVTQLYGDITISNAICFAPDRSCAYFTDTVTRRILRQPLSPEHGWPSGVPELFVDLTGEGLNPDGAVVDSAGCLWNAQWGASRIARYGPDGRFLSAVDCPAEQVSCPAFGDTDLRTLFATSAAEGLAGSGENTHLQGQTWQAVQPVAGQREHQVRL